MTDNDAHTELISYAELDDNQKAFRKVMQRHGRVARFFRVKKTGDVIYTITRVGQPYTERLAHTMSEYWRMLLTTQTRSFGGVQ